MNIRHNPLQVESGYETIYAHAFQVPTACRSLYVSGQIGTAADGSVPPLFEAQLRLAIANLKQILAGAAMRLDDVVKLTSYLTRATDLPALRQIRLELLAIAPAVTVLVVSALAGPKLLIEVEAVAAEDRNRSAS